MKGTRVTVEDMETGEKEETIVRDDWVLIVDGRYRLHHTQHYRNGTVIITVKRGKEKANS